MCINVGQVLIQQEYVPPEIHEVLTKLVLVFVQDIRLELRALLQMVNLFESLPRMKQRKEIFWSFWTSVTCILWKLWTICSKTLSGTSHMCPGSQGM